MKSAASIAVQALLLALALATTITRCWVRLGVTQRPLTLPDYLVCCGWVFAAGWFVCSIAAHNIQSDNPLHGFELLSDSTAYLKSVFISVFFFDFGLYLPKASLVAFYWWLIPRGFRHIRIAIYAATVYLACACTTTIMTDLLVTRPLSHNWSVEHQKNSLWNSNTAFTVSWSMNWSSDILLFVIPFSILKDLKLRMRQKVALCGVFSLGLVTIVVSLIRYIKIAFATENNYIDDATGNLWCTVEMCTATIVVSLPTLKPLIMRVTPTNTSNRSASRYVKSGPPRSQSHPSRSHPQKREDVDDEIELVLRESRKSSMTTNATEKAAKDSVRDTTNTVVIMREVVLDV